MYTMKNNFIFYKNELMIKNLLSNGKNNFYSAKLAYTHNIQSRQSYTQQLINKELDVRRIPAYTFQYTITYIILFTLNINMLIQFSISVHIYVI